MAISSLVSRVSSEMAYEFSLSFPQVEHLYPVGGSKNELDLRALRFAYSLLCVTFLTWLFTRYA